MLLQGVEPDPPCWGTVLPFLESMHIIQKASLCHVVSICREHWNCSNVISYTCPHTPTCTYSKVSPAPPHTHTIAHALSFGKHLLLWRQLTIYLMFTNYRSGTTFGVVVVFWSQGASESPFLYTQNVAFSRIKNTTGNNGRERWRLPHSVTKRNWFCKYFCNFWNRWESY